MGHATAKPHRLLLPVLAVLAFATMGSVSYAFLATADFDQACVQQEQVANVAAAMRARLVRPRSRVPAARGALVATPRDQQDVRWMVEFCDTATAGDVSALREVALTAESPLAAGNAVRALGRLRAVAKDAELLKLLDDPRERVRDETILALGESRDASALTLLESRARSGDEGTCVLAARAIARVGGERARSILAEIAADPVTTPKTAAFARAGLAASGG